MAKQFLYSADEPIVQTKNGKIKGFQLDEVYTFYGIKYAEAERFQPPKPVKPWDGVKEALSFGYICPLLNNPIPKRSEVIARHRFWPENEQCHYLNIWTKSLDEKTKMPVMVWLHGGSFNSGSSIEMDAFDGDNMAKRGDVVFVTLNHRVNILGFLDMSSFDNKYENSVNAGIADLIEALKWVRDNIECFGGDPNNVTIFGQSGGGRKVTTLMQTPAAEGLFHKAIIQSGTVEWNPTSSAHHKKLVCLMLEELEIPECDYEKLERVPYPVLAMAYARARTKLEEQDGIVNEWTPVKNGWFLGAPPYHAFSDYAKKIPLMLGSVIAEVGTAPPMPDKENFSPAKRRELIEEAYGEHTDKLIELFKAAYPDKNELLLLDFDQKYRFNILRYTERKLAESKADVPVYVYLFALEFDYKGGKSAWHCSDIPFVFYNAEKVPVCHIKGVTEKLEHEMSGAWVSFARTGNPNHSGLSETWPEYTNDDRAVMVFDRKSEVKYDHEKELVELHRSLSKQQDTSKSANRSAQASDEKWIY